MVTETEIKAELYDLQHHTCNGYLTVNRGMLDWENSKNCWGCRRMLELQGMLYQTGLNKHDSLC